MLVGCSPASRDVVFVLDAVFVGVVCVNVGVSILVCLCVHATAC